MTCDELSHRLPDLAGGRSRLTADEQQHVDGCPECSGELKLLVLAARLGDDLGPVREPEATARRVLARLAAPVPRRPRAVFAAAGLAAAAVLALAIRSALPSHPADVVPAAAPSLVSTLPAGNDSARRDSAMPRRETADPPAPRGAEAGEPVALIALPELEGMAEGELELVLDQLDRLLDDPLREADVDPADDGELARLLTAGEA